MGDRGLAELLVLASNGRRPKMWLRSDEISLGFGMGDRSYRNGCVGLHLSGVWIVLKCTDESIEMGLFFSSLCPFFYIEGVQDVSTRRVARAHNPHSRALY